jgi:hypothetical protein
MIYIGRYTGEDIVAYEMRATFDAGGISLPEVTFKLFTGPIDLANPYTTAPPTYLFICY